MPGPRSGVTVPHTIAQAFNDMKLGHDQQWIEIQLSPEEDRLVIGRKVPHGSDVTYDQFLASLRPDVCRYILYDFTFVRRDGNKKNRLLFITWIPEYAPVKEKMVYCSTVDSLQESLQGGVIKIQVDSRN